MMLQRNKVRLRCPLPACKGQVAASTPAYCAATWRVVERKGGVGIANYTGTVGEWHYIIYRF